MALEERDPEVLKLNVLLLLLHHPEGVNFGDFSGAFYQLHGCHPNISLYGYRSLKQLVAGMKDLVVVEGSSQRPVLKLAKGFNLACWLEEENGCDSLQEEPQCLIDGEEAEQQSDIQNCLEEPVRDTLALSDVLAALRNLLGKYKSGLKIQKLQEFLLLSDGTDLEKFSINQGYKDTLEFLEDKMPELKIHYQKNRLKCVVQLTADVCDSSASSNKQNQVEERTSQPPGTSSLTPCLDSKFFACSTDPVPYKLMGKMSVALANVLAAVTSLLIECQFGIRIKKLQKLLRRRNGIDLEKFSIGQGYKDSLEFLEDQMPELNIQYHEKRRECVMQLTRDAYSPVPSLDSDFSACSSNTTSSGPTRQKSDITAALVPVLSVLRDYPCGLTVKTLEEDLKEKHGFNLQTFSQEMGYTDVISCLLTMPEVCFAFTNDKHPHESVVQLSGSFDPTRLPLGSGASKTLLSAETNFVPHKLMETRPDSFSSPSSICSTFVPLDTQYVASNSNNLEKNLLERKPGFGDNTRSLNPFCDTSVSKPQDQSLPVPAIDIGLRTSMSMPQSPSFPSFEKACSTSSSKVLDNSELLCPIPVQQPSISPTDRVSCKLVAGPSRKSSLTEDPLSKDLELKQQVAHILAAHPEGMSLFHFRSAYSAMYQQHLPLGNASSVKQRLLEMPDVVHLKWCGVQTLLLPVSSASPVKTGQAVSSTVDKTSMVPGHTLAPATTVTEPVMALKPNPVSKAQGMPQHCPVPLQKSSTPAECTQGHVRTDPKPSNTLFPPQPLIVFPTDSQAVRVNEHFKHSGLLPKPVLLTNPWKPHGSTPVPSASQQVPTNFELRAQPVVYQPTTFLPAIPNIPSNCPTSLFPAPGNPYGIQLQKTAPQSYLYVPAAAPRKQAEMTSPIHSTEQQTCSQAVLQPNTIPQMQMLPRALQCSAGLSSPGHPFVSSPFQNTASFRSPKSETIRQPECSNHSVQDGQQDASLPVAEEKLPDGALKRVTSELSSSRDQRQCKDADAPMTSLSMLSLSSPSPTIISLPPSYASSNIKERSDPPLEPLAFRNQPQCTSTIMSTSGTGPSCSSFLEPTTSPHHQHLHPLSSTTTSVSEVLSSESQSFVHGQSYTSANSAITMSTTCLSNSPLHSIVNTTSSFHQSNDPSRIGIDFDVSDKMDVKPTVFKQTGSHSVPLVRKQTSHPPHHSADKCVLL